MIGILTFYWADDYGAMLQTYALKSYVEHLGKSVEIIPYDTLRFYGRYLFVPICASMEDGKTIYHVNKWRLKRNRQMGAIFHQRRKNMRAFRRRYLTSARPIRRAQAIPLQKYSCVLVGSDQVWNPEITVGFDDAYLGRIKNKGGCRLVSYGASFGGASLPDKERDELVNAIRENFADISLREKGAADFIGACLQRPVAHVLDPTLLLDRTAWERLAQAPKQTDYILLYTTEGNRQMMEYVRYLAEKHRKKVIQVSMPPSLHPDEGVQMEVSGGPAEFLGYVQNAWCVVTNSFHGTVFSVLMEKQFLVFAHSSRNERMESLLQRMEIAEHIIFEGDTDIDRKMWEQINWDQVKVCLQRERAASLQFIEKNIVP